MTPAASAARQQAITEPKDLQLPGGPNIRKVFHLVLENLEDERMWAVSPHLSEHGRVSFLKELIDSILESSEKNDLTPLQNTLEAWYRTSLFVMDSGFWKALANVDETEEPIDTSKLDELLAI